MEDDLKTQYKFVENEVIKGRKIGEFTESEVKKLNFSDKELKWLKKQESEFGLEMKSSLHFAKDSLKSALIKGTYHIPIVRWVNALSTDKTFRNEYIGREGAVYKQTDIKRTLWDKFVTKKMESTTFTIKVNRNTGEITKTLTKIDKEGNVTTVNLSNKDNSKFSIGYKSREDHEFTKVMKTESYVAKVKEKIEMEKKPRLIIVDESSMLSTKDMKSIVMNFILSDPIFSLENAIIFAFIFGFFIVSYRTSVACFASSLLEDVRVLFISSPSLFILYLDEPHLLS